LRKNSIALKPLPGTIGQIASGVKNIERALSDFVSEDENVALLQTISGVGLITATTIRAYTDDINRDLCRMFNFVQVQERRRF